MRRAIDIYYRFLKVLLTLLMGLLIVPIVMQVLSRHTGLIPRFIWTEEIARFCFVWVIMIGAMVAVRDGTHFDVDILPDQMPRWVSRAVTLFVHLAIGCVALTFIYYGYDFAVLGARQQSEISGLPMLSIYIAWPVAGVTWLIFIIERVVLDLRKMREEPAA